MKILVIGNAEQQAECRAKFGPGHHFQDCTSWEEARSLMATVQVIFDFASANSDRVQPIPSELPADVFVDTSQSRLTDWLKRYGVSGQRIYGFCGLRTFLAREVLEVTLAPGGKVQDLEKVCAALGTSFQVVADQAGMISPRVIGMIINEAFYTLEEGTATREDIDLAMKLGTNYPYGPFEWAERIGLKDLVSMLEAVYRETNDERYRICPLMIDQARLS
ncbi:MAG: 3-hydroxyacyl-CoA dehydrogenase [Cyclobacteriaceae bacterium]|nr:3-hydroxyacyl-CoA dehydrogenase [Cyclobacteriaceae bacterium]